MTAAATLVKSPSNAISTPTATLQAFTLQDLAPYTPEKAFAPDASADVALFYVGRDDVHDILKHLLSRVTTSLYLNMFGYDDEELNGILMDHALNPNITMLVTLDLSQAGGVGYKAQNNTLSVILDRSTVAKFQAELIAEHQIAQKQALARVA